MKEIIKKREVPPLPKGIKVKYGNWEFNTSDNTEIKDLSETGVKNIVEKIRSGLCESLYLNPNETGEIDWGFLQLECGGVTAFSSKLSSIMRRKLVGPALTQIIWTPMRKLLLKPVMVRPFSLWHVLCKTESWRQNV